MKPGPEKRRLVYQEYMKRYLRCVKGIDDNLGKVFDYLDASGLAANTVVIYTADQGFFLGEHGLFDKRFMYEESLRVPLLVRWPGRVKPGSVCDELVLNLDYPETILDLAGRAVPDDMQGRSVVPLLKGETVKDWREAFYYRYYFSHFDTPAHVGVRTTNEKLIHFTDMNYWELYDIKNDPAEMKNLAGVPAYRERLVALKRQLIELQRVVGDRPEDMGDQPRTGNPELDRSAAQKEQGHTVRMKALREAAKQK